MGDLVIGVDTGGTFTDFVIYDPKNQTIRVFKIPSTPQNPVNAVVEGFNIIPKKTSAQLLIHGTTVGTNAVLQRKGPKVILLTTKGFEDVIEIGRQNRPRLYTLEVKRPEPLVSRENRIGVRERIDSKGVPIIKLTSKEIQRIENVLSNHSPEAIAISFLFSFKNRTHEETIARRLKKCFSAPISISCEVLPEFREFERTSTTVTDAFLKPIMAKYLSDLEGNLTEQGFNGTLSIFKSDAGISSPQIGMIRPVELLLSGLAGGLKGASFTSKLTGRKNIISLDIGGTSTDVGVLHGGRESIRKRSEISGIVISIPVVDVETIGAGGGSLAFLKDGFFKVGPESAGSDPGPACYGKGNHIPTVTDADVVTGRLQPLNFAGGRVQIYPSLAEKAIRPLAEILELSVEETAEGIQRVYRNNISAAMKRASIERGHDPRNFSLLAFGGQGPIHAAELGESLGVKEVIIPPFPGAWSAMGLVASDYRYEQSVSILTVLDALPFSQLIEETMKLQKVLLHSLKQEHMSHDALQFEWYLELRYLGQGYELRIPWHRKENPQILESRFKKAHNTKYGYILDTPIEIVNLVVVGVRQGVTPKLRIDAAISEIKEPPTSSVEVFYQGVWISAEITVKGSLKPGSDLQGPLIILQEDTTIFIPPNWNARLDPTGHLFLRRQN